VSSAAGDGGLGGAASDAVGSDGLGGAGRSGAGGCSWRMAAVSEAAGGGSSTRKVCWNKPRHGLVVCVCVCARRVRSMFVITCREGVHGVRHVESWLARELGLVFESRM
jgi:hypothetical protein